MRRDDGLKPHYGRGVPAINSAEVNVWGLAEGAVSVAHEKAGTSEGKWITTSHVPPHLRDLPASCVWTETGSTYRLGKPKAGA